MGATYVNPCRRILSILLTSLGGHVKFTTKILAIFVHQLEFKKVFHGVEMAIT
jgi:hypothetical protein